jgi:hypothetical protein
VLALAAPPGTPKRAGEEMKPRAASPETATAMANRSSQSRDPAKINIHHRRDTIEAQTALPQNIATKALQPKRHHLTRGSAQNRKSIPSKSDTSEQPSSIRQQKDKLAHKNRNIPLQDADDCRNALHSQARNSPAQH